MVRLRLVVGSAAVLVASLAGSAHAAPDERTVCTDAYREVQRARRAGNLRAARDQSRICARAVCPPLLQADCIEWLDAVEKQLPSVIFDAQLNGEDTAAVRVTVDDVLVTERLDGKAIDLDPGEHRFKFEVAGEPPIDQTIVVAQGEKNRRISVAFGKVKTPEPTAGQGPEPVKPPVPTHRPVPVLTWVLGAVGVVGVGAFVGLTVVGSSERKDLLSGANACAPFCTNDDVSPVSAKYTAAFVALGVGAAALGTATVLYFTRPTVQLPDTEPSATPVARRLLPTVAVDPKGGMVLGWDGRF